MEPSHFAPPMQPVDLKIYGYAPALVVDVGCRGDCQILWRCERLLSYAGTTYAALRDDGVPLVSGGAPEPLGQRWGRILTIIAGEGRWELGPNQQTIDPRSWVPAVRKHQFQVWARKSLPSHGNAQLDQDSAVLAAFLRPGMGISEAQHCAANRGRPPSC